VTRLTRRRRINDPWDLPGPRRKPSLWRLLTAPQLFVGSFLVLVVIGTLGLRLLPGLYTGARLGWLDCLFTATSAVCVTGLVVVDTAAHFTRAGQAWILLLIQLGGLGIITFATLLTFALGRRLSLRGEELSVAAEVAPHLGAGRLTRNIVLFTFGTEAIGALALFLVWAPALGLADAAWHAIFQTVSAFCNAGFSTFPDNLMGAPEATLTPMIIGALFVVGGLGFIVLEDLYTQVHARVRRGLRPRQARRGPRLSLHSRLVLTTTAALVLVGWVAFLLLEWGGRLADRSAAGKLLHAAFMSVTPRTAGFNTIDYGQAQDATNFLTILLMTVGGSPGSTAGGLKTTTFALIGLLAWSRLRRREATHAFGRTVPEETVQRAVGLAVGVLTILFVGVFVLTLTEDPVAGGDGRFLKYMFECSSAFNTVGLSMGITPALSPAGKVLVVVLMFIGRVGPSTAAAALALGPRGSVGEFRFAYEEVAVG
jgi:trk system potassium uptake protein TrkH